MGSFLSGRLTGTATMESCGTITIDIHKLLRIGNGRQKFGTKWTGEIEGGAFEFDVTVELPNDAEQSGAITIHHDNIRHLTSDTGPQCYTVALSATPGTLGGWRWWFICPITRRRVAKLYLPNGARRFASRHAYRLPYVSQRLGVMNTSHARQARIHRKLGGSYRWFEQPPPSRPKWMRRKTYARLLDELAEAEIAHDVAFVAGVIRFCESEGLVFAADAKC